MLVRERSTTLGYDMTTANIPVSVREAISRMAQDYSVCLLGAQGDPDSGHFVFCGSATLASCNGHCILITAAHVWEKVQGCTALGLTIASGSFIHPTEAFRARSFRGAEFGPWRQDLCFVTVPPHLVSTITARKSLYNLELHRTRFVAGQDVREFSHCAVVGAPGMMSALGKQQAMMTMVTFFASVVQRRTVGELDFVEVKPLESDRVALPSTFGGVSGGGLWAFSLGNPPFTEQSWDGKLLLAGVAFYETPDEGQGRRIQCQGPQTLYAAVAS